VSPPSRVARTREGVAPPVPTQAWSRPTAVMSVPLEAKPASPSSAAGMLAERSTQVWPSVMRRMGKTPFTESLKASARRGPKKAKPS
jgi:hypothetical protein